MRAREYCCCAVPLINAGIYATLVEQFAIAIIVGTLSIATPHIVGASTPSFAPLILAIVCYVAAAVQIFGFVGVAREKPIMFRRYATLNTGAYIAVFAIAAVWLGISASRHSTAQSNCEATFFPASSSNGGTSSEGRTLCDIFPWIDIGVMGGAWVFFALVQAYLLFVVSSYSTSQQEDHDKYEALADSTRPLTDDIPMADRSDPWDARASYEAGASRGLGHTKQDSTASTLMGAQPQKEGYGYEYYQSRGVEPRYTDNQYTDRPRY